MNNNIFVFKKSDEKNNEALYTHKGKSYFLKIDINGERFLINFSFSLVFEKEVQYLPGTDIEVYPEKKIVDHRVRISIQDTKYDVNTGKYERAYNSKKTLKRYIMNNDLLEIITRIRPYIISQIKHVKVMTGQDISIDFSNFNNYSIMEKPENYTTDQIIEIFNSIQGIDIIVLGNSTLMIRALSEFRTELIGVLDKDETIITQLFEKYEAVLSIILFGMESNATFQYKIDPEQYEMVIPDARMDNEGKQIVNLIECKRADAQMFNDTLYRNNTLKIKPEFYNAIHQTNIQRSMLALTAESYYEVIPKSVLIYGNLKKEIERMVKYKNLVRPNLNILKYNNKDVVILTYDELIEKIDNLINSHNLIKKPK